MDCFAVRMIPGSGRYCTRGHCIPPEENSKNDVMVAPANHALLLLRQDLAQTPLCSVLGVYPGYPYNLPDVERTPIGLFCCVAWPMMDAEYDKGSHGGVVPHSIFC